MKVLIDRKKIAIHYKDISISYRDLIIDIKKMTKFSNLEKKSNIMIFMENRPEYLMSFFSIWDSKATAVCIDASSTAEELSYYIDNSECTKIFTSNMHYEKVKESLSILNKELAIINVDELRLEDIEIDYKEEDLVVVAPDKEDTCLILYTSGTTGKPKGVMLSFDNVLANIEALDEHKMFEKQDTTIALLPLHHILPLLGTGILPLINACTIVFLEDLSSAALIETMKKYKVSILIAVPRLWEMIHKKIMDTINSKWITKFIFKMAQKINSISFSQKIFKKVSDGFGGNIKFFVSGGSKLNEQIAADFYTLGIKICEGYGMTETSPMISYTPQDDIVPGCAGKIIKDVEVKIAEDSEILVKGRNVMQGYYKNPEATQKIINEEGWLHTGDLGHLKGSYLYVTGRKKDMIVLSNGKNINPIEIEEKISSMTNLIAEIVVVEFNGILTAVIHPDFAKVKEEKISNIYETLKWSVVDIYNQKVSDYKKVLDVKIVNDDFPKTKIGKIKRFLIPSLLEGKIEKKERKEEPTFEEYLKIKKYLANIKGDEIYQDSHLEIDLKMDSLDMVEFLHFLEQTFSIKEEDLIAKYPVLIDLATYISKNKGEIKLANVEWKEILEKDNNSTLPNSSIFSFVIKFISLIVFNIYLRVKVENKNKLAKDSCIYIGNHQSFLDGFIFNYAVPSNILKNSYFVATVSHFKNPVMKFLANHSNIILVDKQKDVTELMQIIAKILKNGKNIVIFPEGLRTRDGKINEFKKTFAIIAKELRKEIQPFVINGAYEAFPTGAKFPKPAKLNIKFLDRIKNTDELSYEEIVEKSFNLIKNELEYK